MSNTNITKYEAGDPEQSETPDPLVASVNSRVTHIKNPMISDEGGKDGTDITYWLSK